MCTRIIPVFRVSVFLCDEDQPIVYHHHADWEGEESIVKEILFKGFTFSEHSMTGESWQLNGMERNTVIGYPPSRIDRVVVERMPAA